MDPDGVGVKTEYSPLNNMSSSGEDVEQFSLPVTPVNPHRPKRRRKRKEFDSMRGHTLFHSFRKSRLCHNCGSFFLVALLLIMIAGICGLGAVVYYMSNNVAKMQKLIDNLQVAKGSTASSLISLQSKSDSAASRVRQLELVNQNLTARLAAQEDTMSSQKMNFQRLLDKVTKDVKENTDSTVSNELQKQLARFGSDIATLKGDVASLQQKQLSAENRLTDLDNSLQALSTDGGLESSEVPADEGEVDQLNRLRSMILLVNDTCVSTVRTMHLLLVNVSSDLTSHKQEASIILQRMVGQIDELLAQSKNITNLNASLANLTSQVQLLETTATTPTRNQTDGMKEQTHSIQELTRRVDEIETYVKSIRAELSSHVTNNLENQVVNLTITTGIEDIITRVISQKTADFGSKFRAKDLEMSELESRVESVENNIQLLENKLTDFVSVSYHSTTSESPPEPPLQSISSPSLQALLGVETTTLSDAAPVGEGVTKPANATVN